MELDVSKAFLSPGTAFPFEARVPLGPQEVTGETITFDDVELQGAYRALDESVHLKGTLQTKAHGPCALCMTEAEIPVQVRFAEVFRKDANEAEDEVFRYEGKSVPLGPMTLTLVMLNLPMRFVCGEGCPGSAELQAWQRDHSQSPREDGTPAQRPFEALRSLLTKDEEV